MSWDKMQVNGQQISSQQQGQRVEQLDNFRPGGAHDHIVSNDGLNADYVRINGEVVVDNRPGNPNPYGH
ncbi:MAG: hypothetical protein WCB49_12835 [Gammaproteobacteria bacterium]